MYFKLLCICYQDAIGIAVDSRNRAGKLKLYERDALLL